MRRLDLTPRLVRMGAGLKAARVRILPELGEALGQILVLRTRIPKRLHPRRVRDIATLERVELRVGRRVPSPPRLVRHTSDLEVQRVIDLVEQSGAWVVADDLCIGTREFFSSVDIDKDAVDSIAERYLRRVCCSRTFRERTGSYQDYILDRFGHIGDYIKDYKVDGVVLYIFKYCDPFGFDVPEIKSYIESMGVRVLYLEDEYSMSTIGRLRTRIQAFLELISL